MIGRGKPQEPAAEPTRADRARLAVEAAVELHARHEAQFAAISAELHSLRDRAGAEALDRPEAVPELAASIGRVEREQDVAARASEEARRRIDAAQRAVWVAEAADADAEAADLDRQGADLQRRIDALREPLEALAGVPFAPRAQVGLGVGAALVPRTAADVLLVRAKTLRSKAANLRQQAERAGPEAVAAAVAQLADVARVGV